MKRTLSLAAIVMAMVALSGLVLMSVGPRSNPARAASDTAIAVLVGSSPEKAARDAAIAFLKVDSTGSKDRYIEGLKKVSLETAWTLFMPNMEHTWADYQDLQLNVEKVEVENVEMLQEPRNGAAIATVTARVTGTDKNGALNKTYTLNLGLAENPRRKGDWKLCTLLPNAPSSGGK